MKDMSFSWKPASSAETLLAVALAGALFGVAMLQACAPQSPILSPEQNERLEIMNAAGPDASLTILPIIVAGKPFDRVTEAVGLLFEQKGLQRISLGTSVFASERPIDLERMAAPLGEFVKKEAIATEYALYAEFGGKGGLDEIRAIVVDRSGSLVWSEQQTPRSGVWKKLGGDRDLLVACSALAESLAPRLGLNKQTARNAQPGKMATLMAQRSGLPPENETAPIPGRQEVMKRAMPEATLLVVSPRVRTAGGPAEPGSASGLAKMIADAGLCNAKAAARPVVFHASQADPNEMKVLWDFAREFRDYVRKNPMDADYVLCADFVFNPSRWEEGAVHLVVCDREGAWVIADLRNSHHPEYQRIKPVSQDDCGKLLVEMLKHCLG